MHNNETKTCNCKCEEKEITRFDLAEALRAGVTPEDMIKDFMEQLNEAKETVAAEKEMDAANQEGLRKEARESLKDALFDYFKVLGLLDDDLVKDEELDKIILATLEGIEEELDEEMSMMKFKKPLSEDDFIKTLLKLAF